MNLFRERVKALRKDYGMTQSELGQQIETSLNSIVLWESGRGYPSFAKLLALCTLFNVSADYLTGLTDAI